MARLWLRDYEVGVPTPVGRAGGGRIATEPRRSRFVTSNHRVLAAILLTAGPLGIAAASNVLVGPWQVLSFAVLALVLAAGLVLMCARVRGLSRRRGRARARRAPPPSPG